jgi:4-hydroxybenzoate polyprenyltransferase
VARSTLSHRKNFIQSLLKLTRFGNLLIIAFAQYFTAACLIGLHTLNDVKLHLLISSTVMIAAAGYIINDYYDVKIDYINKPDRVVIGKAITRRYAILYHVILSILGILGGLICSLKIGAINTLSVFLLWFYSNNLKRLPFIGNLTVALLTGFSVLLVDFLYQAVNPLILTYATFAFFMTLIREIIKDIEDLKGDNTFGCKTLPIIFGLRKTKYIIYAIVTCFVAMVLLLNHFYPLLPLSYYLIFLFVPLLLFLYRLLRADMKKDFSNLSSLCKAIMLLGILSMAFV